MGPMGLPSEQGTAMFAHVPQQAPDAIFGINAAYKADTSPDKVNLVIGAYRDNEGKPWVLPVVKDIEKALTERTDLDKEYAPIAGVPAFCEETRKLILGKDSPSIADDRVCTVQTLSGTGGLSLGFIFVKRFMPAGTKVLISNPSWANHKNIAEGNGIEYSLYRYYKGETAGLDFEGMVADLKAADEGSVVLLHACAHNPTGVDLSNAQWDAVRDVCKERKLIPFFDCAYQGFATGDLDGDAFAVRAFDKAGMNMMIPQSYSKNFGLYGERCGALSFVTDSSDTANKIKSQLSRIVRQNYSNPPRHGAQIVAEVLKSEEYVGQDGEQLGPHPQPNRDVQLHGFIYASVRADDVRTPRLHAQEWPRVHVRPQHRELRVRRKGHRRSRQDSPLWLLGCVLPFAASVNRPNSKKTPLCRGLAEVASSACMPLRTRALHNHRDG